MTIQEAIKSGKPYRQIGNDVWYRLGGLTGHLWTVNEKDQYDVNTGYGLTEEMILADNWEIKQ
jgi:hypothetical protein